MQKKVNEAKNAANKTNVEEMDEPEQFNVPKKYQLNEDDFM